MCGPLISARQRDRVEGYLRLAVEEGGSFAAGGGRPADRDRGFWIEPTLVTGLDNAARTAREEIFGPVLVVIPHDGDADAVRLANDSPYGLSGAVHSGEAERAWARRARGPYGNDEHQRRRLVCGRRAVRWLQTVGGRT